MWEALANPANLSSPNHAASLYAGVDVGGSTIEVLVVDGSGRQQSQAVGPTDAASPERLVTAIEAPVSEALKAAGKEMKQVAAVGMGFPGRVDPHTQEVANAVNLNLEHPYPFGTILAERWQRPLFMENDARVAVLGAYQFITSQEAVQHLAYVNIGTGISSGLVLNGRLYRGANGLAGEIGHMVFDPQGETCACGLKGCLETMASGAAIHRLAAGRYPEWAAPTPPTAKAIYALAQQGDERAVSIVRLVSGHIGRALQWIFMAYDVEKVILGGGVTRARRAFLDPILIELSRLRGQSALAEFILDENKISLLPAGYNPGTWGAVLLARMGESHLAVR